LANEQALSTPPSVEAEGAPVPRYAYSLTLLTTIYVFNFVDRQIVTIVAEPIKAEFALKDWQLGSMTGLAFAVLYTIAGFPIARLAERGDRAHIIAFAVISWSLSTALCGLASSFLLFVIARRCPGRAGHVHACRAAPDEICP
jgi:predicted MFS family arabinose efflux permease